MKTSLHSSTKPTRSMSPNNKSFPSLPLTSQGQSTRRQSSSSIVSPVMKKQKIEHNSSLLDILDKSSPVSKDPQDIATAINEEARNNNPVCEHCVDEEIDKAQEIQMAQVLTSLHDDKKEFAVPNI